MLPIPSLNALHFAEGSAKDISVGEAAGQIEEGVKSLSTKLPTSCKNAPQHFQAAEVTFDQDSTRPVRDVFPVTDHNRRDVELGSSVAEVRQY